MHARITKRAWQVGFPLALVLTSLSVIPAAAGSTPVTVIVVRHAEKIDDSRDPVLSEAGAERAQALAEMLEHAGLDAVYASQYRRTRLTAEPAAEAAGLKVIVEPIEGDIGAWAQAFSAALVQAHSGQTVLVAGHSNTVPPLVAALCRCDVAPLEESDYDRLYILNMVDRGSQPRFDLIRARYGEP